MLGTLLDLIRAPEFLAGLVAGFLALALGMAPRPFVVRWRPMVGLLFSAATLAGVHWAHQVPLETWLGVGLLALAGVAFARRPSLSVGILLALPGAALVSLPIDSPTTPWGPWLTLAALALAAPLVADFDRHYRTEAIGPSLLALSVIGVLFTVPDTELPLTAVGAVLPLALLGWPGRWASLGTPGAFAATGTLLWIVARSTGGREVALVAGLAALGFLVAEPAGRRLSAGAATTFGRLPPGPRALGLIGGQAVAVALLSRVAGKQHGAWAAALVAVPLLVAIGIGSSRLIARFIPGRSAG
ncbi:MAG: hypothetical protein ACRD02_08005 [Acidimicrobiia bacterium]